MVTGNTIGRFSNFIKFSKLLSKLSSESKKFHVKKRNGNFFFEAGYLENVMLWSISQPIA
jgi:hypothetical protein